MSQDTQTKEQREAEAELLWEQYFASGKSMEGRDALILHYSRLVRFIARRAFRSAPSSVDFNDLYAYGLFGLIEAIERFEPEQGFKFGTFASVRIRGSIIDELRVVDWVPRSQRKFNRDYGNALSKFANDGVLEPSDEQVARYMDLPVEKLRERVADINKSRLASLNQTFSEGDSSETLELGDTIVDEGQVDVEEVVQVADEEQVVRTLLTELKPKEETIAYLYYFEGMTLREIGDMLGVTESRICQIQAQVTKKMKQKLESTYSDGTEKPLALSGSGT